MSHVPTQLQRLLKNASRADIAGIAALTLICLAFFWRIVFTDLILPRGDTFAYFYPYWSYRDAALAAGKIPLWNPYLFMGAPFLANSQSGVLYPLNWPLVWLDAPNAVKVALVGHILIAAWGMYGLSRRRMTLSVLGAVFSSAVFALGGYLTSQVEHINQLQGLAWLPWLLWAWDEALDGRARSAPLWLTAILAMQILAGHTQTAFISVVGLLIWTGWHIAGQWRDLRVNDPTAAKSARRILPLARPFLILLACGIGAAALTAAQLLPTFELTGLSNRGGGGLPFLEALSFSLRPYLLGRAMLPGYAQPSLFSEYVGYIGVTALIVAMAGAWIGRRNWRIMGFIVLAGASLFLALGAYNPVYWGLVKIVPGFGLFRAPARWLALWAMASAILAGYGLDQVASDGWKSVRWSRVLIAAAGAIVALIGLTFLSGLAGNEVPGAESPGAKEIAAWVGVLALTSGLLIWQFRSGSGISRQGVTAVAALGLVELFVASQIQPFNQLTVPEAWRSQRPAISTILAADRASVPPPRFLSLSDILFDPGDLHEIQASYQPYLNEKQIYDAVIATKQKEILAPNLPMYWGIPAMDGFDGGILPTRDYTRFTSNFVAADRQAPDGRLRENLKSVPDLSWLRIANVRWIITDKVYDAWLDGVYYDLQFAERADATSAQPILAYPAEPFEANRVGVVGHIEGSDSAGTGTRIGTLIVHVDDSEPLRIPLVVDASQSAAIGAEGSDPATAAGNFSQDEPDITEYRTLIDLPGASQVADVMIEVDPDFAGAIVVRGMTLIDGRVGAFSALTMDKDRCLSLANSGDVKVYRYDCMLPRAYVVCNPVIVASQEEAWTALNAIPGSDQTVIEDGSAQGESTCIDTSTPDVTITDYQPESISASAQVDGDGAYLVLSDAWYPGWEASVDGQPTPVLRANGLFRAVRIPSGEHQITFRYRSRPFETGSVISGIALIGLVAGLMVGDRRRRG